MHTVPARLFGDHRLIGKNSRGWATERLAWPAAVVQIPPAKGQESDIRRDGESRAATAMLAF